MTSFVPQKDEQGHCVLQTSVKILFCDLKLGPGESKVCKLNGTFLNLEYYMNICIFVFCK